MKVLPSSFDGNNAFSYLHHLSVSIGSRLSGSKGEQQAADYIKRLFVSFGLNTRMQKFPVHTFHNISCSVSVCRKGAWSTIPSLPIMPCKNTPPNGIQGELFFADNGDPEYFSPAMRGKIVIVCGRIKSENRPRFLSYNPKALIIIEPQIKDHLSTIATNVNNLETYGNLPMVVIRHMDGFDLIKKGCSSAKLLVRNSVALSHAFNVIGDLPGSEITDEIAVVCSHYDSHMGIAGAADNAGGTAVMLELARVLSAAPSRRTIRFIAFAAEETGLHGSTWYACDLLKKDARDKKKASWIPDVSTSECLRHRLVFNLDVHGLLLGSNTILVCGSEDCISSVRLLAKELGVQMKVDAGPMSSDGTPLAAAGIPAVQFGRYGGATMYGHSEKDVIDYLSPDALQTAGRFSQLYLQRYVADCPSFPFPREIPDDQIKKINEYFDRGKLPNPATLAEKLGGHPSAGKKKTR